VHVDHSNALALANPTVASPAAAKKRSMLIDVVRGMAITLVCLGHTNQGISHRQWWGDSTVGAILNAAIYAFHMPAFFFVSGVFLLASVQKRGQRVFLLEKLRSMIYPYVLWTCIFFATSGLYARFTLQSPQSWHDFLFRLVTGAASWFLPSIFFAVFLATLTRRVPLPLLFVLAVAVSLFWPGIDITFVDRGLKLFPFLLAGMWARDSYELIERIPAMVAAACATLLCAAIFLVTSAPIGSSKFLYVPLGLLGTLMLMLFANCLGRSAVAKALAWIGEASLGIFLLSPFLQGAGREALLHIHHTTAPYPQLILPTLLAILVPACLYQNRARLHVGWLFVSPF
jgi:fucose 4-O-acetylase-like acetyltransferase